MAVQIQLALLALFIPILTTASVLTSHLDLPDVLLKVKLSEGVAERNVLSLAMSGHNKLSTSLPMSDAEHSSWTAVRDALRTSMRSSMCSHYAWKREKAQCAASCVSARAHPHFAQCAISSSAIVRL
eukprot:IDg21241t1